MILSEYFVDNIIFKRSWYHLIAHNKMFSIIAHRSVVSSIAI